MSQTTGNNLQTHTLANGRTVFHLNEYETEFLYKELFTERVYLKHGIQLTRNSVVVDVGANIGLLAVFLQQEFPGIRLVLVEPSPVLGEIIRANIAACGANAVLVPAGLADTRKTAEFTFYAGYSIISGFKADLTKDAEFLRGGINNQLSRTKLSPERKAEFVESLMEGKLENPQKFTAQLISFNDLVTEQKLARVDLLKIDAEGCELEILHGIGATNWPKIQQVVMEVHEAQGFRVGEVVTLLEAQGFNVVVEQEEVFHATGIYNLYARRR
ncbi:MAG: hypothetical protein RLZZ350_2663 [Verrucomicrobiota bacterium]|jgi:FkbM family methyltransferase